MRISYLAYIAIHVSASTIEPNPLVDSECKCALPDQDSASALNAFLSSVEYKQYASSQLLSENDFSVVISRVSTLKLKPASDTQVEAALEGRESEDDLSIVFDIPIPRGDFIAVHGMNELHAVAGEWTDKPSEDLIMRLVILSSKVDILSKCESLTCKIWRAVLRQVSLQQLVGVASQWDLRTIIQGLTSFPIESGSDVAPAEAFVDPVTASVIIGCVAQCLCYCGKAFVEWYCATTTLAPTTTTLAPINVLKFAEFPIVNSMLDEAVAIVRAVTSSTDAPTKQTIAEAVARFNAIVHKIPASIFDWPQGNGKVMFLITNAIQQAIYVSLDKDLDTWPTTARQLLDLVEEIRTNISLFGVVSE